MRDRGQYELRTQQTKLNKQEDRPGLIRGLHLMQGITVKGAGPAVWLARDGHFPREQGLVVTGLFTDRDHFESAGLRSELRAARLRAVAMVGPWTVPALAPPAGGERALAEVSSRRALGPGAWHRPLAGSGLTGGRARPGPIGPARTRSQLGRGVTTEVPS